MGLESRLQTVRGGASRAMQRVDLQRFVGPCVQQQSRVNAVLHTRKETRSLNPALREKINAGKRPLRITPQVNELEAHQATSLPLHLRLSAVRTAAFRLKS